MTSLSGRRIVVTGAASGIGAAVVAAASRHGAAVLSLDRNPGPEVTPLDVTDDEAWRDFVGQLQADTHPVHGLVCCAGTTWRARLGDVTATELRRVFDVNVLGTLDRWSPGKYSGPDQHFRWSGPHRRSRLSESNR